MKIQLLNKILDDKNYKRLMDNFLSLSGLQIASYILPLITLPYLVRVLGPDKYGLIAFSTAFIMYFQIITDWGFNFSATRQISINREDKQKLSEIFSSVIIIKTLLMISSLIFLTIIVFSFNQFKNDWLIYFLTFGIVLGNVLFPTWFFQGIEKMRYISILNILSKLIFTLSIFIFIREANDFIYVPLINSLGFIIAGIIGIWIVLHKYKLSLKLPTYEILKFHFIDGWHIFLSSAAASLYVNSNTFILGLFTTNVIVSYFAIAITVVSAVIGLLSALSQSIYPYISKLVNESKEKGIEFIKSIIKIMGIFGLVLSLILFIFAGLIVDVLFGGQYSQSIIDLRILAFLPLIIALSNVFGIQTMLTLNYKKAYSNIYIIAGIINIILAIIMIPIYKDIGSSLSYLISEIIVIVIMYLFLHYKKIKILSFK